LRNLSEEVCIEGLLQSALVIPLSVEDNAIGLCVIGEMRSWERKCFAEGELAQSLASQASVLIEKMRLHEQTQFRLDETSRHERQLNILHLVSDYIQEARDLETILHVVLTGITAGYGLGFNRAAIFLIDDCCEHLVGRMGIGYLTEEDARRDWENHLARGMDEFEEFIKGLEQNTLLPTPIEKNIGKLQLRIMSTQPNALSQTVASGIFQLVTEEEITKLPGDFIEAFAPGVPMVVIPLMARKKVVGLLVADSKFTHSAITEESIETLTTYGNTAAIALENARLFNDAKNAFGKLRSSFLASNALVSSQSGEQVLKDITQQALTAAGAIGISIVLVDKDGQARKLTTAGKDEAFDVSKIRPDGFTARVMATGHPEIIEDTAEMRDHVNPTMFPRGVKAALCLPMSLQGEYIGVMWIHYGKPRSFLDFEIDALQLYVNQAAIVYDSSRRMQQLEIMRQASDAMARVADHKNVLQLIAKSAKDVLRADYTLIWSYDDTRDIFIPEELVAENLPGDWLEKFRQEEPGAGKTTRRVLEKGYIKITHFSTSQLGFLGENTRTILKSIEVKSFQGICLSVGE